MQVEANRRLVGTRGGPACRLCEDRSAVADQGVYSVCHGYVLGVLGGLGQVQ